MASAKFEVTAQDFRKQYPIGTTVFANQMVDFAREHGNGLAPDLLIDDVKKQLSALRRHINTGAASRNVPEEDRFVIEVRDAKRGTMFVRSYYEHVQEKTDRAVDASIVGAMAPVKRARQAAEDIKVDELDDKQRKTLEATVQRLMDLQKPLAELLGKQREDIFVRRLQAEGLTEKEAKAAIRAWSALGSRYQRLLKATS